MTQKQKLDWPALMRVGIRGGGLRPDEFWALTPAELQLVIGQDSVSAPLLRDGLAALMAAYPDKVKGEDDGI